MQWLELQSGGHPDGRPAMTPAAAAEELRRCARSRFWPDAVDALLEQLHPPEIPDRSGRI